MKKFDEAYEKVISSFFDTETAKNWPKDRPWPNPRDETLKGVRLVLEDKHKDVNIGETALGYLKSELKEDIINLIDNESLKDKTLMSWKHYKDFCICCMDKRLWILQTDFSKHQKAERQIKAKFGVELNLEGSMKNTDGLTAPLSDKDFIMILDVRANDGRLQHEFIHCVQLITGKITGSINGLAEEVKKHFSIGPSMESYVFNEYEFWDNIYTDLFNDLQKNYWLHHKSMKWEDYVGIVAFELKNDVLNYRRSWLGVEWREDKSQVSSTMFLDLLACVAYVNEKFFNQIIDRLKNR